MPSLSEILFGKPERLEQISSLSPQQQQMFEQYLASLQGSGAGGAYGDVADYYRSLLNPGSEALAAFERPLRREFEEDILPGLAEQFAGLGAGGLSSSAFRNSAQRASTELGERLATLRSGLRQQAAQGLQGFAAGGFNPVVENVRYKPTSGLAGEFAQGFGQAISNIGSKALGNYLI